MKKEVSTESRIRKLGLKEISPLYLLIPAAPLLLWLGWWIYNFAMAFLFISGLHCSSVPGSLPEC
jgi:hypothetical protein